MDETKVVSLTSPADMHAARNGPRYEAIGMPEGDIRHLGGHCVSGCACARDATYSCILYVASLFPGLSSDFT